MNIFTDALYLFAYLVALLYMQFPDVINTNYLVHKFYLFIEIFIFYYVIQMIKKIKNNCKIDANVLLYQSLNVSILCVLGYSIYVDCLYMDWTKDYFNDIDHVDSTKRIFVISFIIVSFFILIQLSATLFSYQVSADCS